MSSVRHREGKAAAAGGSRSASSREDPNQQAAVAAAEFVAEVAASVSKQSGAVSATPSPSPTGAKLLVNEEPSKKWHSAWVRTYTTLLMLGGFTALFLLGHVPLMLLIVAIQVAMFRELKRLSKVLSTQQALPSFRPLHWYWFCTAMWFSYGKVLAGSFHYDVPYHAFTSFALYILGVAAFVLSLEKGYYKYQFEMFAWVHLVLLLIVVQSTVIVVNMFQGLIWFILPALLIISNDTWAYIFGFFFGRTPLIALSPKKTWEGFIGAFFATLLTGFFLSRYLAQFDTMVCEKTDLTWAHPHCQHARTFLPEAQALPQGLANVLTAITGSNWSYVAIAPIQWHGLALALFASILAPFGGFFASGFKRAFNIKDFGESIPGHGGVTDRMDCQVLAGLFVYVYYWTFVKNDLDLGGYFLRFQAWPEDVQLRFFEMLRDHLTSKGLLNV